MDTFGEAIIWPTTASFPTLFTLLQCDWVVWEGHDTAGMGRGQLRCGSSSSLGCARLSRPSRPSSVAGPSQALAPWVPVSLAVTGGFIRIV